ncbi:MAG TPA: N-acetyltransferase [Geminicoccaceae bacterium]|nr:N-acetyltransferase [Geminicoccaceae bacterium]
MFDITAERPEDGPVVDGLLDQAFGPGRRTKASYRYREDAAPERRLCLVARDDAGRLVGSIRHWPVVVGDAAAPALLLGPLAVDAARRGQGIGRALVWTSLGLAAAAGYRIVLLVGDLAYYRRFGFATAPAELVMPGERSGRLLAAALAPGALGGVRGLIRAVPHAGRCVRRRASGRPGRKRAVAVTAGGRIDPSPGGGLQAAASPDPAGARPPRRRRSSLRRPRAHGARARFNTRLRKRHARAARRCSGRDGDGVGMTGRTTRRRRAA